MDTVLRGGKVAMVDAVRVRVSQNEVSSSDVLVHGQVVQPGREAPLPVPREGDDRGLVKRDPHLHLQNKTPQTPCNELSLQLAEVVTSLRGGEFALVHPVGLSVGKDEVLAGDVLVDGQVVETRSEGSLTVAQDGDDGGFIERDPQFGLNG